MFGAPPGPFLRWLFRLPVWLYRMDAGRLPGDRFLLLTHTGRRTGLARQTVLEVMRHDRDAHRFIVASGWGDRSEWLRNIEKNPEVLLTAGNTQYRSRAVRLSQTEACAELSLYANGHPFAARWIFRWISGKRFRGTSEEIQSLAARLPVIAFRYL